MGIIICTRKEGRRVRLALLVAGVGKLWKEKRISVGKPERRELAQLGFGLYNRIILKYVLKE
jgi:hypothetical protein